MQEYEVVVIGGGSAGITAAIQAGRAGAKTLLVEKCGRLGGTTVQAGISYPGLFHAWGKQIIAGIGWELVEHCARETGYRLPDFTDLSLPHYQHQPFADPMVYAYLCDQYVLSAGCDLRLHTMLASVRATDKGWSLQLCGKEGLSPVVTRQLIDCTGDANAVTMAGLEVNHPDSLQPSTLNCHLDGYDLDRIKLDQLNQAFAQAVAAGELKASDGSWWTDRLDLSRYLRSRGHNGNHLIAPANACDSIGRTALEVEGRMSVYRLFRFLKRQPGFEQLRVREVSAEVGVRETVTIRGKTTVTLEDFQTGRVWDDSVCFSYYIVDLHGMDTSTWVKYPLNHGVVGTIPRRALLPDGSKNLLVAGRCFSSDRYANSAMRVQASCMAMGQAAGAIAALANRRACDPQEVSMNEIRSLLVQHQAIVP